MLSPTPMHATPEQVGWLPGRNTRRGWQSALGRVWFAQRLRKGSGEKIVPPQEPLGSGLELANFWHS